MRVSGSQLVLVCYVYVGIIGTLLEKTIKFALRCGRWYLML